MAEYYVQPKAAYKQLKEAQNIGRPVYIYGVTGYGKTSLVKNFFRNKKVDYRLCTDTEWKKIIFPGTRVRKRFLTYVFDDVQFLTDEKRREEICALLRSPQAWVILVSRGCRPGWLLQNDFEKNFLMISERDLRLDRSEMDRLLLSHHVKLEDAEANELLAFSQGNGYALSVAAQNLEIGLSFRETMQLMARVYYQYVYNVVMEQNTPEVRDFVSMVSVVKHFTLPLAEKIMQRSDVKEIIRQIEERSNFLARDENGWYFRDPGAALFHRYGLMRCGGGTDTCLCVKGSGIFTHTWANI